MEEPEEEYDEHPYYECLKCNRKIGYHTEKCFMCGVLDKYRCVLESFHIPEKEDFKKKS